MKIIILNESKQSLGGGWSFIRNFKKGMEGLGIEVVERVTAIEKADIYLIPSPTMVQRATVEEAKKHGKVVLRLDNIPRNSRNRGTGTPRLYDIAQMADLIVYQSLWAKDYLMPFVKKDGPVVYNGVDTSIFYPKGLPRGGAYKDFAKGERFKKVFLYSRYNRDETKGWERVWFEYQMIHRQAQQAGTKAKLVLVGQFSDELRQYNFDFYNGEEVEYYGIVQEQEEMAQVLRGCDVLLAPYYNDCYSNTIQEALACGLELRVDLSGGTAEMLRNGVIDLEQMSKKYLEVFNELL